MTYNHRLPIVSDRVMLIGDAASLINPLNGEGIQYALLSARWAAETLAPCLRSDDFSARALAPFAARVERNALRHGAGPAYRPSSATGRSPRCGSRHQKSWHSAPTRMPTLRASYREFLQGCCRRATRSRWLAAPSAGRRLGQLASKAVTKAFSGPRGAGPNADTARANYQLASDAAMDPADFAEWLKCAAACTLELGSQAAWSAIAGKRKGR